MDKYLSETIYKIVKEYIEINHVNLVLDADINNSVFYNDEKLVWYVIAEQAPNYYAEIGKSSDLKTAFVIDDEAIDIKYVVANISDNVVISTLLDSNLQLATVYDIANEYIIRYNLDLKIENDLRKSIVLYEGIFVCEGMAWVVETRYKTLPFDSYSDDEVSIVISDLTEKVTEVIGSRGELLRERIENSQK